MSNDFFLLNRAFQVARLYGPETGKPLQRPPANTLAKLPERTQQLYALLDQICAITNGITAESSIDNQQREKLSEFERSIVRDRFHTDPAINAPAVQLIKAIFADASYFSGLKPLPQYTDKFPYELLFPSWLNLLTAIMLPRVGSTHARIDGAHQVNLFQFLGNNSVASGAQGEQLVAFLTFLASRYDGTDCRLMLQRLINLVEREGEQIVFTLRKFDDKATDGNELKALLGNYLTVKYSQFDWPEKFECVVSNEPPLFRPLPSALVEKLTELETSEDFETYKDLLQNIATVVNSKSPLSIELTTAFSKHRNLIPHLSKWMQTPGAKCPVLSEAGQSLLATLAVEVAPDGSAEGLAKMDQLVSKLVYRADGISEAAFEFFRTQFVNNRENFKSLVDASTSDHKLQQLATWLLQLASKTDSNEKCINLLSCATLMDRSATSIEAQSSLNALQAVIDNRSIGTKELSDIVDDLQKNIAEALNTLANPMSAISGKSERLTTLYLTLNEIAQTLHHSGKVDNFSVLRAKYTRLSNL